MTKRDDMMYFEEEQKNEIIEKAKENNYDFLPRGSKDSITGVFLVNEKEEPKRELNRDWLLSISTTIPQLLNIFLEDVEKGHPGHFVIRGKKIEGLVTPSDLNRIPVRVYIFNLVAEIEFLMIETIERICDDTRSLIKYLSQEHQKNIEERLKVNERGNADVPAIHHFNFSDLIMVIQKDDTIRELFDYKSKTQAKNSLGFIVKVRNRTVHQSRPMVGDVKTDVKKFHKIFEKIIRLKDKLNEL
jgi:hypothetical protein